MGRARKRARRDEPEPNPSYDTPPTQEEWDAMKTYGSFTIMDQDKRPNVFYTGDHVLVLPTLEKDVDEDNLTPDDQWIAKIDSIHAQAAHNAWMRVQWYYHPEELKKIIPSFPTAFFGSRERILSDHFDFVPTISCNGRVRIVKFQDDDPYQELDMDTFFYRATFGNKEGKGKRSIKRVQPLAKSCVCNKAYGPDLHLMHWCSKCKRWFHKDCLSSGSRTPRAADISPMAALLSDIDKDAPDAKKVDKDVLGKVEAVSQHPIVRGLRFGLVGNARYVEFARNLLQEILSQGADFVPPADWEEEIGLSYGIDLKDVEPWYECPVCKNYI